MFNMDAMYSAKEKNDIEKQMEKLLSTSNKIIGVKTNKVKIFTLDISYQIDSSKIWNPNVVMTEAKTRIPCI